MIDITKDEMEYLVEYGRAEDIHLASATHKSKHKTRFVTESPRTLRLLNEYRTRQILATYGGEK